MILATGILIDSLLTTTTTITTIAGNRFTENDWKDWETTRLHSLCLDRNRFSGTFPSESYYYDKEEEEEEEDGGNLIAPTEIPRGLPSNLRSLSIAYNHLIPQSLTQLQHLCDLTALDLSHCRIADHLYLPLLNLRVPTDVHASQFRFIAMSV